ncbi:unnamed protein product [Rotaria sordida]|uniref:NADH dehydrogenase [ubiquinone] 1 beta subcomplex subunit 5, mitochondrial n=1 Tax=Rotaria sordida TaxID=392033 RepID=A0A814KLC5_9BILA|nr:unnamed protein product [Rotaria sordida]CAF1197261.1 unnamed protein product [Rotaria sordida]CAF1573546.1 unnamed protein product [Rotaria sordida]CAF3668149.1 unnamed protein product [Rotaria sordida]CAF3745230.1 unnamed protein product [Rotaria sordida]
MVLFSKFRPLLQTVLKPTQQLQTIVKRWSSERRMRMMISEFHERKFFDLFHYYFLIGLVPTFCIVFYANVFVGQAKLAEVPEDYEPRHWEYYKHPLRRFMARYVIQPFDERYEISLHAIYTQVMRDQLKALERKVRRLEQARGDHKGWYYRPIPDHLAELEQKKAAERSDGFSAMVAPRELPPPRTWPVPPKTD